MQFFLKRFKNLSVARPSTHPTANDSSHIEPSLFHENSPTPSVSSQRPKCRLVTDVVVKHSSAFNSERAAGMSKLQQLQFIEAMKGMIIDNARLIYPETREFKVIMSRKERTCPASPNGFCDTAVHVVTLLVYGDAGNALLDESEEREYLADAVENLWGKVLEKMGEVVADLKSDGNDSSEDEFVSMAESGETFMVGED